MTDRAVLEPFGKPEDRLPWEYVPNEEKKCLEFVLQPEPEVKQSEPEEEVAEAEAADEPESEADSTTDSDLSEESPVELGAEDDPAQASKCCKCCRLKHWSPIRMINWPFLICMTVACCLAAMCVGSALFNDGPIGDIVAAR